MYRRRKRTKLITVILVVLAALLLAGGCWYLFIFEGSPLNGVTISIGQPSPSPTAPPSETPELSAAPTDAGAPQGADETARPTADASAAPKASNTPLPTATPTIAPSPSAVSASSMERSPLTKYNVLLNVNIDEMTVKGKMSLRYVNRSRDALYAVQLYLHANGASPGSLDVNAVGIDNVRSYYTLTGEDGSILTIPLKMEIMPYESALIFIDFTVRIPEADSRFGSCAEGIMLGNMIPTVAVYESGAWRADGYVGMADPFYSETSDYVVSVELRNDYTLASTGDVVDTSVDGKTTKYRIKADSVRDFALALFKTDAVRTRTVSVGTTTVTGYGATTTVAQFAADTAADALKYYNELIGKYPYKNLHVVPFCGGGGMEYPGLVMIDSQYMRSQYRSYGACVIAHEVAHQWFYGIIGSDQVKSPWLDESLTEYLSVEYIKSCDPKKVRADLVLQWRAMDENYSGNNLVTDSIYDFTGETGSDDYYYVVYCYGADMYEELKEKMGEEKFALALSSIYNEYYMGMITREALVAEFSDAAGYDLTDWFDARLTHSFKADKPQASAAPAA